MKLFLLLLLPLIVSAQNSDILLLRRKHTTIRQYFPGNSIEFFTTEHMYVSGNIDSIKRDSLFLTYYDIRMVPNIFGSFAPDTASKYQLLFSIHNIGSFPARQKGFNFITNGTLLMMAGGAYLALNVINTLSQGEKVFSSDNSSHLIIGASLLGAGILLHQLTKSSDEFRLGKKYYLKYLPVETGSINKQPPGLP